MRSVIYLILSFYASVIYTFSFYRAFHPSSNRRRLPRSVDDDVGLPLHLTPLIDAGNFSEAINRSRVQPPLLDGVDCYTGFLTVNKAAKSHLYFWFVPKTADGNAYSSNDTTPLIVWLQGGPGGSSLYGLFAENGPFRVSQDGRLEKRQYAWTDHYHLLYIDQPVGAGFSYTETADGYVTNEVEIAQYLYDALAQFYKLFPGLQSHDLYLAGESYAGKYIPEFGYKIHTANSRSINSSLGVPLKGMLIGNGVCDPLSMQEYSAQLRALGLIDERERAFLREGEDEIRDLIRSGQFIFAEDKKQSLRRHIMEKIGFSTLYDYTRDNFTINDPYVSYLLQDGVRKRVHVGSLPYQLSSSTVKEKLKNDIMRSTRPWIERLLAERYTILFYNGQFDMIAAHSATENFLSTLRWSGAYRYNRARQQLWLVDGSVAGYYKFADNLVYVMVRNAGHMVPADQPRNSLVLIDRFIGKQFRATPDNASRSSG